MPPPVSVIAWGKLTIPAPRLIIETDRPPAEEVIGAFTPIAPLPPVRERPPPATLVIVTSEVVALPIRPVFMFVPVIAAAEFPVMATPRIVSLSASVITLAAAAALQAGLVPLMAGRAGVSVPGVIP